MSLALRDYLPHVLEILLVIIVGIFVRVFVKDVDDLTSTVRDCERRVSNLTGRYSQVVGHQSNDVDRVVRIRNISTTNLS